MCGARQGAGLIGSKTSVVTVVTGAGATQYNPQRPAPQPQPGLKETLKAADWVGSYSVNKLCNNKDQSIIRWL